MKKYFTKHKTKEILHITLGVFLMTIAYGLLVDPSNLVVGGVGGIATLLRAFLGGMGYSIPSWLIILAIDGVLLLFAILFIGKNFFFKTVYASVIYPVMIYFVDLLYKLFQSTGFFVQIQDAGKAIADVSYAGYYLLIVLFGSVLTGLGVGIAFKNGASTGGTDILQEMCFKYLKMPYSVSLYLLDGTVVLLASIYFHSVLIILYGVLYIFVSGYVMDSVAFSGLNVRQVNIITSHPDDCKKLIFDKIGRGVTEVYSRGGYSLNDGMILTCVMSNHEFYMIRSFIYEIDPAAFIYITKAIEVHGEGFSREGPLEQSNTENKKG